MSESVADGGGPLSSRGPGGRGLCGGCAHYTPNTLWRMVAQEAAGAVAIDVPALEGMTFRGVAAVATLRSLDLGQTTEEEATQPRHAMDIRISRRVVPGWLVPALIAVTVLGAAASSSAASAHSLADVQNQLYRDEQYFQVVNREFPKFALADAAGRPVALDNFRGKVVVLHFIDGHCKELCPLHSELLAQIQAMIDRTPMRDQVEFVSITVNPSQDTPEILDKYGPQHGFDPRNWVFLTTRPGQPEDTTRKLAEALGQKFTRTADGDFIHGIVTYVIDQKGMLRGNFLGLKFEPTNLVVFINALANDVYLPGHSAGVAAKPAVPSSVEGRADWLSAATFALLALGLLWLVGATAFFLLRRRRRVHSDATRETR